jgi:hypothetical protein
VSFKKKVFTANDYVGRPELPPADLSCAVPMLSNRREAPQQRCVTIRLRNNLSHLCAGVDIRFGPEAQNRHSMSALSQASHQLTVVNVAARHSV